MIPMISENVLSYTINSLFSSDNLVTLGIAIALLITPSGTAYTKAVLKGSSTNSMSINPISPDVAIRISEAETRDFPIKGSFCRVIFRSRDPSSTIKINPIIPKSSSGNFVSEKVYSVSFTRN